MLKLLWCEFAKLRRRPLFFAAAAASALIPLGCALFLPDFREFQNGAEAVDGMMSVLFQMSAYLLLMPALVVLASAAELCGTDYGAVGVAVIVVMYLLRDRFLAAACLSLVLLVLLSRLELYCIPAFLAIALYNGKRGRQPKYFFYVFYPAHLLLLWAIGNYVLPVWM